MGHWSTTKKHVIGGVVVGLFVFLAASMAFAATLSGQIQILRINTGASAARVSIFVGGSTACVARGWFAYENAATGLGLVRTQGLLAAYQAGHQVTIHGTGTCDGFGFEQINSIDLE
jgi:hypothetical protein